MKSRLPYLVVLATLLQAGCFFYFAHWMTSMYRALHASWHQSIVAGEPDWIKGLLLLVAAILYWTVARSRLALCVLAIAGAINGAIAAWSAHAFVHSYWGIFQGDLIALAAVSDIGFVLIGILAVTDTFVARTQRGAAR
jgi:hypothetical protein